MPEDNIDGSQNEIPENNEVPEVPQQETEPAESPVDTSSAEETIERTLLSGVLGYVNFDGGISQRQVRWYPQRGGGSSVGMFTWDSEILNRISSS